MQVWRSSATYRDVFSNFSNRSKTSHGLTVLFNSLYDEIYGYRLQLLHLINCFNIATIENQNKTICEYQTILTTYELIVLDGVVYNTLLDKCDNIFGNAIT